MRSFISRLGVAAVLALLYACSGRDNAPLVAPDRSGWKSTHDVELDYPIPGHEDKYRRIFISPEGEKPQIEIVKGKTSYRYPDGTQVVKEIYDSGKYRDGVKPTALTVMVKNPNHPLSRRGWIWILKDLHTGTETIIEGEFCVTCHANANERHPYGDGNPRNEFRDYLFFPYPRPLATLPAVSGPGTRSR